MASAKRTKKIAWIIAALLIGIPLIMALVAWWRINDVVRAGVQVGGTHALGVPVQLADVDISLLRQQIMLEGLRVGNPEGFSYPTFAQVGRLDAGANVMALRRNELHVREVLLDGPEFTFEMAKGRLNVNVLLDRLKSAEEEKERRPESEGAPLLLKVDRFLMTNARVRVVVAGKEQMTLTLSSLEIRNIADKDGNGIPPERLLAVVLGRLADQASGGIGGTIGEGLGRAQEKASEVIGGGVEEGRRIGESIKGIFKK